MTRPANTPVALFGHSRRQLFANAAIAASRLGSYAGFI